MNAFTENPNKVLDRDKPLNIVQYRNWEPCDRSVDVLAGWLRNKIENNSQNPKLNKTVRRAGYVFATTMDHE